MDDLPGDDAPLRLEELAQVDSPEIMRAALDRFRRRTLVRGAVIALVVLAVPFTLRGAFAEKISSADAMAQAVRAPIGAVLERDGARLVVLDARRVDPAHLRRLVPPAWADGRFLHLVVTTDRLRARETLEVSIGSPSVMLADERDTSVRELFVEFAPGTERLDLFVLAARPGAGRSPLGPRVHRQRECAVPLNESEVCELPRSDGRVLARFTLDLAALDIPRSIWGVTTDAEPGIPTGPPHGPPRDA